MADKHNNPEITIKIFYENREISISGSTQESVLQSINNVNQVSLLAPCGGKGWCGKCKIIHREGNVNPLTDRERSLLSREEVKRGIRLACLMQPKEDITIELFHNVESAFVKFEGIEVQNDIDPSYRRFYLELEKPSLEDQRPDLERLLDASETKRFRGGMELLQSLPSLLRENDFRCTSFECTDKNENRGLISVEAGEKLDKDFAVAVDIGTTTIAAYLVKPIKGLTLDVFSQLNRQSTFGADVVSRISYAGDHGGTQLTKRIRNQIDEMIGRLCSKNNIEKEDIYAVYCAGNTTMVHFLLGLDPKSIAVSPFIPASTQMHSEKSSDFQIRISQTGILRVLPSISAYVGADIVAAILSSGITEREEPCLLIDIGTNGEIVLGNKDMLYCCSTAAGPAFEGANLSCGTGGVPGAVDSLSIKDGGIDFSTISGEAPIGICGSGVVDSLALLLEEGLVDDTGRMLTADEVKSTASGTVLAKYLGRRDSESVFFLVNTGDSPIFISQKDVREIQLAKAAIAAGIRTLLNKAGLEDDDLETIFLTGGFGSFIDVKHAMEIGLFPEKDSGKVQTIGNAAGIGTVMCLCSRRKLELAQTLRSKARYIELSSSAAFGEYYIEEMVFSKAAT